MLLGTSAVVQPVEKFCLNDYLSSIEIAGVFKKLHLCVISQNKKCNEGSQRNKKIH